MKVVYFLWDTTNPFWREVVSGIEKKGLSEGMSLEVVSCNHDGDKQLAQLQAFSSYHPDALFVSPVEMKKISSVCKTIFSTGIPIISVDYNITPNVTASVISGNMQGGLLAAGHIADQKGTGTRVVHIKAEEHLQNVRLRSTSFVDEAMKRGLTIVEKIQADGSREIANSKMAEFLEKNIRFDAIFAENDNMAIGAIAAIEAVNLSPYPMIVGYDGTAEAQVLMRSKRMDASIAQDATMLGQKAVEVLVAAIKGNPIPAVVTIIPRLLTSADLK